MDDKKALSREEAESFLVSVSDWEIDEKAEKIYKEFKFRDFIEAISFVKKVAVIAEKEKHHPEIHIYYNKVVLDVSTHEVGGLSEKDFNIAAKIDTIVNS